jgi:hypothetical protein
MIDLLKNHQIIGYSLACMQIFWNALSTFDT